MFSIHRKLFLAMKKVRMFKITPPQVKKNILQFLFVVIIILYPFQFDSIHFCISSDLQFSTEVETEKGIVIILITFFFPFNFIYLFICLFVCLFIYLFIYLFIQFLLLICTLYFFHKVQSSVIVLVVCFTIV